jgi:hypothetical protein
MDWCETNIEGPQYANAITSIPIIVSSILIFPNQFFLPLFITGFGSVLFHYYPCFITQYIDEFGIGLFYILFLFKLKILSRKACSEALFFLFFLLCTGKFVAVFFMVSSICIYIIYRQRLYSRNITKGVCLIAVLSWILDFLVCPAFYQYRYTFHAIWHLSVSVLSVLAIQDLHSAKQDELLPISNI